ncbi:hypothetical protein HHI36_004909 [Cryptolaemus montrouzieri]|uniref:Uncharacterized protein n=1 Tax=Cryptolaemus montrouzieri TaxID=559131 RepID=A0ABD2NSK9_9CUCU
MKTKTNKSEINQHRVVLPYVKGVTTNNGRVLKKRNITPIFRPFCTICHILPTPKEKITLENEDIYGIPCKTYKKMYIGQTNRICRLELKNKETQSKAMEIENVIS